MGEATGFLKWARETPTRRPVPVRLRDWREVYEPFPTETLQTAGRPVHGLRHPVLQQRLPARQPHPRLERPRLPRPLARRDRAAARHQQLPRVHRPAVPGAVRGRVRARHQRRPGHDQAGRGRDHRPGLGRGLGRARSAPSVRTGKRVAVIGSGPAGLAAAQQLTPRRPRRGRARAGRPHRRPAALRHPRVQDGEAPPRPAPGPDARPRAPSSAPTPTVGDDVDIDVLLASHDAIVLACGATAWRDLPMPGPRAATASTRPWSTCRWANRVQQGDLDDAADHRRGQARRHHRRRRHRRRLPRHRPPPGRGVSVTSSRSCPARPTAGRRRNPWPQWQPDPTARRRRTRRAASASSASTPSASSTTATATCGRCALHEVEMVDGPLREGRGHRLRAPVRARAAGHGLRRPGAGRLARAARASSSTSGATWPATTTS